MAAAFPRCGSDFEEDIMRTILKSAFLWQFAAGFALGALGMVTLTPAAPFAVPGIQHPAR